MRELALKTRIKTLVIWGFERGWSNRLPKRAYQETVLPQLERHQELTPSVMQPVLCLAVDRQ